MSSGMEDSHVNDHDQERSERASINTGDLVQKVEG